MYNCPFCNRNNVIYKVVNTREFDWKNDKVCYATIIECSSCNKKSLHLSFEEITYFQRGSVGSGLRMIAGNDIDSKIFYSAPTSFFVIDNRIPKMIRELISEADGCLKMNFLTGASACARKAIYELLIFEKITGENYEERIKSLKSKYQELDPEYFDVLFSIQQMTSEKVHEQSWDKWDSKNLTLIIETLKSILHEIYVIPAVKKDRINSIKKLRQNITNK